MIAALLVLPLAVLASASPSAATPASAPPAALGEGGPRLPPVATPLPVPADAAEIVNSGSTNTAPYRIVITPAGDVSAIVGGARQHATVARDVVAKLFADLASAPPASFAVRSCMKSASFGSSTSIRWQGTTSGDVSCGGDSRAAVLMSDARAIETAAGIDLRSRGRRTLL